jgi:hypothetical protein
MKRYIFVMVCALSICQMSDAMMRATRRILPVASVATKKMRARLNHDAAHMRNLRELNVMLENRKKASQWYMEQLFKQQDAIVYLVAAQETEIHGIEQEQKELAREYSKLFGAALQEKMQQS